MSQLGMAACVLGAIDWGSIAERIVGSLIMGAVIASVTAYVLVKVHERSIRELANAVMANTRKLSMLETERLQCELRQGQKFASHGEVAAMLQDRISGDEEITRKLDQMQQTAAQVAATLHSRVTELATTVARMEGAAQGGPAARTRKGA